MVVVPVDVFRDAAAKTQFASAGTVVEVASVGYGIAVRTGAPKPDISTPDALKRTLLGAKSIAFVPASAAGAYILKVFERLDIADAMKAKTVPQTAPSAIAPAVAKGEADLAVFLTNVLFAPGVELVGPFPPDLQQELVFAATIAANTNEADAATAFVNYLRTPAAISVIKAAGMNPGKRGTY